jgi:2-keto-3-deoxy-L-rhamnonate aldolase RhmA
MPGKTDDPVIRDACRKVANACGAAGKSAGMHVVLPSPEAIESAIADGFTFIAVGADSVFLASASRDALAVARKACD